MPSIAMLRAKDLLNMAVLRRVVGAVSRALIFLNGRWLGLTVALWPPAAVVRKFDFPASL
jgi:hypothetical protein